MKVYDRMPSGLDCPIVGINVSDPSVVCTANIAPASPHHTLPIYRRFWSRAYPYETPGWASIVGPNQDLCATQYVLSVRPNIPGMALLLGDSSMDSIVAAALLGLQENGQEIIAHLLSAAICAIREDTGLVPWKSFRGLGNSQQVTCLAAACDAGSAIDMKVDVATDWLMNGLTGRHVEHLKADGAQRTRNYNYAVRATQLMFREIQQRDREFPGSPMTTENLSTPAHFRLCLAYKSIGDLEELMRVGFDHTPVVIAATDRRYSIGVHPGAAVALDVPRLLDRLEQMEAAALAYEKPREAVMAYLAKQPTGWRMENHRITACSLLHSDEVMEAVWACMLGSKKLPA